MNKKFISVFFLMLAMGVSVMAQRFLSGQRARRIQMPW